MVTLGQSLLPSRSLQNVLEYSSLFFVLFLYNYAIYLRWFVHLMMKKEQDKVNNSGHNLSPFLIWNSNKIMLLLLLLFFQKEFFKDINDCIIIYDIIYDYSIPVTNVSAMLSRIIELFETCHLTLSIIVSLYIHLLKGPFIYFLGTCFFEYFYWKYLQFYCYCYHNTGGYHILPKYTVNC